MATLKSATPPAPTFSRVAPRERTFFARGFTLTEMAVVLVIVALLIGGMILPMTAQQDVRYSFDTQKQFADISEALVGFAASKTKPYLPCPDVTGDGLEDRAGGVCTAQEGNLPWATLGLGRQDAWGNPFRYRVAATFSGDATGFTLSSVGDIRVCEASACAAPTVLASTLPAVVLSLGKNGTATPTDADELKNRTIVANDPDFVQHNQTGGNTGFDDLLVWLPTGVLIHRMISAGRLP